MIGYFFTLMLGTVFFLIGLAVDDVFLMGTGIGIVWLLFPVELGLTKPTGPARLTTPTN